MSDEIQKKIDILLTNLQIKAESYNHNGSSGNKKDELLAKIRAVENEIELLKKQLDDV